MPPDAENTAASFGAEALLVQQLAGRFDYAFSTISKENTRAFNAHTKDGWQVMGEDDHYHYVVLPVPPVRV